MIEDDEDGITDIQRALKGLIDKGSSVRTDDNDLIVKIGGTWWLLVRRAFLASCSSSWGWGCIRTPCVPYTGDPEIYSGPCDYYYELGRSVGDAKKFLRDAVKKIPKRPLGDPKYTPQSSGKFLIFNIDLWNAYKDGKEINNRSKSRLQLFNKYCTNYKLNQCGYEVVSINNDSAILIAEPDNKSVGYVMSELAELNYLDGGVCVGISYGDLIYITDKHTISESINDNWIKMRRPMKPGQILIDLPSVKDLKLEALQKSELNLDKIKLACIMYANGKQYTVKDLPKEYQPL